MSTSVRQVDRGAAALKARLAAKAQAVEVGIIGDKANWMEGSGFFGVSVADVALWAEYGLGQPQRSWLRDWIEENQAALATNMRAEAAAIKAGTRTKDQALARLGLWIQGAIQERIANGIEPPNADSTIQRKGSSKPLIDTGQLRSSISHRVTE